MHILETALKGKHPDPSRCEDGLVITEELVAVIDGVTSKSDLRFQGMTGGVFAKNIIASVLTEPEAARLNAAELFDRVSLALRTATQAEYPTLLPFEFPRATLIVCNARAGEVWCYGDCPCIIGGRLYDHAGEIDALTAGLRALRLEAALLEGSTEEEIATHDIGREYIMDILRRKSVFENRDGPFGYPVINGGAINPRLIVTHQVAPNEEIVLASDGYPILCATLAESEAQLERLLAEDPLCYRSYRATKGIASGNLSFDDRTYCRFIL